MGSLTRCPHCNKVILVDASQSIQVSVSEFEIDETVPGEKEGEK